MSNGAGKDLTQVNTENQTDQNLASTIEKEAKDQPAVEQNIDPAGVTIVPTEQPRSADENVGQKAPKTSAAPSRPNPSRKRAAGRGEASGGGEESQSQSRQGYTSLRMRADNHPEVLREKKTKGAKSSGSNKDK
ncbi:hypothetical protein Salat_2246000 [Sesamum alatum]|uniref:Uncharacterized protein n=1 Tax=Sesamum alatum TaxID=300844 RepID=A0AAE1XVK0_9LAMI|nr:hypothetical protein Salat_2246000 [Sesamum alatum]